MPEWLAKLEDVIFENLPTKEAILWPERFLKNIPIGINLEKVKNKIAIHRMSRIIKIQTKLLKNNSDLNKIITDVINCINIVKKCHEAELNNSYCDFSAAWSAAWSARSADSAAWSAAWKEEAYYLIKCLKETNQ